MAVSLEYVHGLRGPYHLRAPCGGKSSLEKAAASFGGAALLVGALCAGPPVAHGEMLKILDGAVRAQQQQESTEQALQLTPKEKLSLRKDRAAAANEVFPEAKQEKAAFDAKASEVVENAGRPATKKDVSDLKKDLKELASKEELRQVRASVEAVKASVATNTQLSWAGILVGLASFGSNVYLNRDKL